VKQAKNFFRPCSTDHG